MAFKELSSLTYKPVPIISLQVTIPKPITGIYCLAFDQAFILAWEAPPYTWIAMKILVIQRPSLDPSPKKSAPPLWNLSLCPNHFHLCCSSHLLTL